MTGEAWEGSSFLLVIVMVRDICCGLSIYASYLCTMYMRQEERAESV